MSYKQKETVASKLRKLFGTTGKTVVTALPDNLEPIFWIDIAYSEAASGNMILVDSEGNPVSYEMLQSAIADGTLVCARYQETEGGRLDVYYIGALFTDDTFDGKEYIVVMVPAALGSAYKVGFCGYSPDGMMIMGAATNAI